jgi:hypothetical protein
VTPGSQNPRNSRERTLKRFHVPQTKRDGNNIKCFFGKGQSHTIGNNQITQAAVLGDLQHWCTKIGANQISLRILSLKLSRQDSASRRQIKDSAWVPASYQTSDDSSPMVIDPEAQDLIRAIVAPGDTSEHLSDR